MILSLIMTWRRKGRDSHRHSVVKLLYKFVYILIFDAKNYEYTFDYY